MTWLEDLLANRPGGRDILDMLLQVAAGPPEPIVSPLASPGFVGPTTTPTTTPTPTPTPAPTKVSGRMKRSEIMNLIKKYFPENEWENAYRVALGESGGNPSLEGDRYDIKGEYRPSHGLFQIREFPNRPSPEELKNPETNVKFAAQLWKAQKWKPWTVGREIGLVEGYETRQETMNRISQVMKLMG